MVDQTILANIEISDDEIFGSDDFPLILNNVSNLMSARAGFEVSIDDFEVLAQARRGFLYRIHIKNNPINSNYSAIVKHINTSEFLLAHEIAAYKLITSLEEEFHTAPTLLAHDLKKKIVVLEDMGINTHLSHFLLDSDYKNNLNGIKSWAKTMGIMHTSTIGREKDLKILNPYLKRNDRINEIEPIKYLSKLALEDFKNDFSTDKTILSCLERTIEKFDNSQFRSFSPQDVGPWNCALTNINSKNGSIKFIDLEWSTYRDVTFDVGYVMVLLSGFLPNISESKIKELREEFITSWSKEVQGVWPVFGNKKTLCSHLIMTSFFWVWLSQWWSDQDNQHKIELNQKFPGIKDFELFRITEGLTQDFNRNYYLPKFNLTKAWQDISKLAIEGNFEKLSEFSELMVKKVG